MSKLMDLQYKLLDRMRDPRAFELAAREGAATDFSGLRHARQALLVTFKRSGTPMPTPVNFGLDDAGRLYFRSEPHVAKIRRIRNDPHVRVGPCNLRGKPLGPLAEGRARILPAGEEQRADAAIEANWSAWMKLFERVGERFLSLMYVEVEPQ